MEFQNYKKYLPNIIFLLVGILVGILIGFLFFRNANDGKPIYDTELSEEANEDILNEEEVNIEEVVNQELMNFYNEYAVKAINLQVGSTFTYGRYEQDNIKENGKEDIEWIVLYKSNKNSILLVSKKILDTMPYNLEKEEVTWETSEVRDFLNKEFFNNAFNDYEKLFIMENEMTNNKNANYKTEGGVNTFDRVFLLSESQANKYFHKENKQYRSRGASPTAYAKEKGIYIDTANEDWDKDNAAYWLRTPGIDNTRAELVEANGDIFFYGEEVSDIEVGIRPCIWIKY